MKSYRNLFDYMIIMYNLIFFFFIYLFKFYVKGSDQWRYAELV